MHSFSAMIACPATDIAAPTFWVVRVTVESKFRITLKTPKPCINDSVLTMITKPCYVEPASSLQFGTQSNNIYKHCKNETPGSRFKRWAEFHFLKNLSIFCSCVHLDYSLQYYTIPVEVGFSFKVLVKPLLKYILKLISKDQIILNSINFPQLVCELWNALTCTPLHWGLSSGSKAELVARHGQCCLVLVFGWFWFLFSVTWTVGFEFSKNNSRTGTRIGNQTPARPSSKSQFIQVPVQFLKCSKKMIRSNMLWPYN